MKTQQKKSFNSVMSEVRVSMSLPQKITSYILHFRPIEMTLTLLDTVILRPYSIIFSAIGIILATLAVYIISIYTGHAPYGVEQLIGLVAGFILGSIVEVALALKKRIRP